MWDTPTLASHALYVCEYILQEQCTDVVLWVSSVGKTQHYMLVSKRVQTNHWFVLYPFCNWRRPFWGRNILPSEAVYHVFYTQEPTIPLYRRGSESLLYHSPSVQLVSYSVEVFSQYGRIKLGTRGTATSTWRGGASTTSCMSVGTQGRLGTALLQQ